MIFLLFQSVGSNCPIGSDVQIGPNGEKTFIPSEYYLGCTFSTVTVLPGITLIGGKAFFQCMQLRQITFPTTLHTIDSNAFSGCSSLQTLSLNEGLVSLGQAAFFACDLSTVTLPSSLRDLSIIVFSRNPNLNNIISKSNDYFSVYDGTVICSSTAIVFCSTYLTILPTIPSTIIAIGSHSFGYCNKILSLSLPNSIQAIASRAFYDCSLMSSITLGENLASLAEDIFEECLALSSINVATKNDHFESQDGILFSKGLEQMIIYPIGKKGSSYNVLKETKSFGQFAFSGVITLSLFTVQAGNLYMHSINGYLYSIDDTELIRIPPAVVTVEHPILNTVVKIADGACVGCQIKSFLFPNQLEIIGEASFRSVPLQGHLIIPSTIKEIGNGAFQFGGGITQLNILGPLLTLNPFCFAGCGIITASLPNSIQHIQSLGFADCFNLATINLPTSLRTISLRAFQSCFALLDITFPSSLEYIGNAAFISCISLTKIRIPMKTMVIEERAFSLCTGITEAILENCGTKVAQNAFEGVQSLNKTKCIASKTFSNSKIKKSSIITDFRKAKCIFILFYNYLNEYH